MKLVIITRPVTAHTVVTLVEDYPNNLLTNQPRTAFIYILIIFSSLKNIVTSE